MYTHDLFYLQVWEAWLAPVYKQIQTIHQNKVHAATVKMVHNNYNTTLCMRRRHTQRLALKQSVRTFAWGALS